MIKSIDKYLMEQWEAQPNVAYRLHSRFNHAINWVNDNRDMITFLTRDLPNAPNTLLMNADNFNDWDISDSSIFMKNSNGYFIDECLISNDMPIKKWAMHLPIIYTIELATVNMINLFLNQNCEEVIGVEKKIYEKLDDNYHKLMEACDQSNYEKVRHFATQSIGLGLGLTPSGDDRLVGFLLGCYTQPEKYQKTIQTLQLAIDGSEDRTNEISYAMLKVAREGRFNEWLLQLVGAIRQDNLDDLIPAMTKVFAIGSRSGGDMLKGLVLSLEMMNKFD